MDSELTVGHLVRLVRGSEFMQATYRVREGLVRVLRVQGDMVFGRVWDMETFLVRLQLVPPFEGRCSCRTGGACSHVAALGLAYLHQQRGVALGEESAYRRVESLDERGLRGLAMELLANFEGAPLLAADFLLLHEVAECGTHPDLDEMDAQKVCRRLRSVLDEDQWDLERASAADRHVRTLLKATAAHPDRKFRVMALAGLAAELAVALDRPGPVVYRWRALFLQALEPVVQFMARRSWPHREEMACLRHLLNAYPVAGDFAARHLKATLLASAHTPVLRDWLEGESKQKWRDAQGTPRKRLRALIKEVSGGVTTSERRSINRRRTADQMRS